MSGAQSKLEPPRDTDSGLGASSSNVERKSDPVVTAFPQTIPGSFEAQTETSASITSIIQHSSQEPGVATAKRGKKKKAKASTILSGSSVAAADQDEHGEESGLRESNASSSSAVAKSVFAVSEPISQPQFHPQPKLTDQVTLPQREPRLRSSPSFDTDGSWTRVISHCHRPESDGNADMNMMVVSTDFTSSDVGASTAGDSADAENTEEEMGDPTVGSEAETCRTLAEKLVPKPRRTGVDDMLQRPDVPTLGRVMRVMPRAGETPAPGFTWGDYEDITTDNLTTNDADGEDEGGWGIVKGKSRSRDQKVTPTPQQITKTTSEHTMTKKQRQNAKKREMVKAAKAEAEATRLEGLAKHKRELERERIIELSRSGGGKRLGGGMQATVDDKGKLVWE
ncbi:hypothetical protein J3A83DRAFT_356605 [Scleroderma citrinum]